MRSHSVIRAIVLCSIIYFSFPSDVKSLGDLEDEAKSNGIPLKKDDRVSSDSFQAKLDRLIKVEQQMKQDGLSLPTRHRERRTLLLKALLFIKWKIKWIAKKIFLG